jgi:hypothetical protein
MSGLAICLAIAATAFAIWWLTSLNGLPDIGDPFDVAALREITIPDDQNAFTFLQRAHETLTPLPDLPPVARSADQTAGWTQIHPKVRAWVEANRPALELLRQGADQSDGIWNLAGEPYWQCCHDSQLHYRICGQGGLLWLALLEGRSRAESGDPKGAWDCYRTVLRMTTHLRRRGGLTARFHANTVQTKLRHRLEIWAADPKTTIPELRRALDEALLSQPRPEWDAFSLKIEYMDMMRQLELSDPTYQAIQEHITYHLGDLEVPTDLSVYIFAGHHFVLREPDRSRRALRLLFANWLAHVETPPVRQSQPAVRASFTSGKRTTTVPLYSVSLQAPSGARALSPHDVANWLVVTKDAKPLLSDWLWPSVRIQERKGYHDLVVLLASELYRRERGVFPPREEVLVGAYLQALPDDGSAELDDGTAPTVADPRDSAATPPK